MARTEAGNLHHAQRPSSPTAEAAGSNPAQSPFESGEGHGVVGYVRDVNRGGEVQVPTVRQALKATLRPRQEPLSLVPPPTFVLIRPPGLGELGLTCPANRDSLTEGG